MFNLVCADVLDWAKNYEGPKFHAALLDPPYHLQSIVKRFGKKGSAPAKYGNDGAFQRASRGFMNQTWDGGDIAFDPETWHLICQHLLPGAFGVVFASARGWHRVACAIEDAGMIIHPTIFCWVYSSGMPKATNISKLVDRRAGAKRKVVGTRTVSNDIRSGNYKKGSATPLDVDITLPATELARTWESYRYGLQALKPAAEPIIIFQKPHDGKSLDGIIETGAGALYIDGTRIGRDFDDRFEYGVSGDESSHTGDENTNCYGEFDRVAYKCHPGGRWPANFVIQHTPNCRLVGFEDGDGYAINRFTDGAKPFGGGAGHEYESKKFGETIPVWECSEDCPAKKLGEQSGISQSKYCDKPSAALGGNTWGGTIQINRGPRGYTDKGTAARYFFQSHWSYEVFEQILETDPAHYCAKASTSERNAGLDEKNLHPTVKPIALTRYLATLLLPPVEYAPRRILVPFAGVASEMIGALLAGWDEVLGVELKDDYCCIGQKRLEFWAKKEDGFHVKRSSKKEKIVEDKWDW